MSVRIHLRPEAVLDVDEQANYYLGHASFSVSTRFYNAFQQALDLLASQPEIGQRFSTTELRISEVRVWRISDFGEHLIFYRYEDSVIDVIRVLHGKQDIDSILSLASN